MMNDTPLAPGLIKPTAQQLLSLSYWSGANNPLGLSTARHWKSDLGGLWFWSLLESRKRLQLVNQLLPDASLPAFGIELLQQSLDHWLLQPARDKAQQAVIDGTDPDPFKQQNCQIESRYAELTAELCQQCFIDNRFSPEMAAQLFIDPQQRQALFVRIAELAALEYRYNSQGLTRLTAQKELLTTLLMLITGTEVTAPHPYRKYDDNNQPLDSLEAYLAQCQLRLEKLYQQNAFDLVHFSEHSAAAKLGCCDYQVVDGSAWHGVKLRYYPSPAKGADNNPVLYLNSPLINRAEIFDLAAGKSVIEGLLQAGHHLYLVDFTDAGDQPAESGQPRGLDFFGKQVHDRYLDLVIQQHPNQPIHAMGYCMGGSLLLTYLARRAEEREAQGLPMDITKLVLMATPVRFDDDSSGHGPMRQLIRDSYDETLIDNLFDGANIPPQMIEAGMHQIQPGVRYTVTRGFYERATFDNAIEDAAPFLNWLNHGTRFPARAHRQWIQNIFIGNQIWNGEYRLSSTVTKLDGQPVDMHALTRAGVQLMDYRGLRDPISPIGSCIASQTWGAKEANDSTTTNGLNRTIEKNIGHIFVVSRKHLAEFLERALHFYQATD